MSAPPPPDPTPAPPPPALPPLLPGRGFFSTRAERWAFFGLLALALALRMIALAQAAGAPYFDDPILDGFVYDLWGRRIAAGHWTGGPQLYPEAPRVFYQDPLYPYLLGLLYLPGRSAVVVRVFQILVGVASCALLYAAGRRLFGRAVATAALAVAACYKPFLFYDTLLLKTFLEVFFLLLAAWLALVAVERDRRRAWIATGLALGVGALARGNFLMLVPALLAWIRAALPEAGWSGALRRWGWVALGAAAGIAPATIHNAVVGREFILTTAQAGPNFYTGNHPGNQKGRYHPPDFVYGNPLLEEHDFHKEAERRTGRKMSAGEVDRYWLIEGLRYAWMEPSRFAKGLARKTILFWIGHEYPDNVEDMTVMARYMPLLRWPLPEFGWISPLALLGIGLALTAWRRLLLPLLVIGVYAGSLVLFFLFARYRLPAVPFLLLFAAYAAERTVRHLLALRARRAAPAVQTAYAAAVGGTVALLALATSAAGIDLETCGFGTFRPTVGHFNLAKYFHAKGRLNDAREELLRARAAESDREQAGAKPWGRAVEIHTELALIALAQAREPTRSSASREALLAEADGHLDRAEAVAPHFAAIQWERGVIHRLRGKTDEAVRCFERALDLQPSLHDARLHLAETLWERGDRERARALLEEVIAKAPAAARAEAHHMLGQIAMLEDNSAEARRRWQEAVNADPSHLASYRQLMHLHRRLAEAYLARKDTEAANVELVYAIAAAEHVLRLDPSDETAAVLLQQYQRARSRQQPQRPTRRGTR